MTANSLSLVHWRHGDGAEAASWTARALELVTGVGPTHDHVHVLAQAARYMMVAGRQQEAMSIADEAIALADAVGAPRPRAAALITRATARANGGDDQSALEDLDDAIALVRIDDPFEYTRARVNLGSILLDMGDVSGSIAAQREAFAFCERTGTAEGFGRFVLGNVAEALFYSGEWGEAEALAGEGIEHAERTGGQYHEPLFQSIPAELGLVREGHTDQAVAVARSGIEQARPPALEELVQQRSRRTHRPERPPRGPPGSPRGGGSSRSRSRSARAGTPMGRRLSGRSAPRSSRRDARPRRPCGGSKGGRGRGRGAPGARARASRGTERRRPSPRARRRNDV